MIKNLKTYLFSFTIIAALLFISCNNKNVPSISSHDLLTIEKIKENYKNQEIKQIKQFGKTFALAEVKDDQNKNFFELYNLETGERNMLPTLPYKVSLSEIIDENNIKFICDGENYESNTKTFPFVLNCVRNSANNKGHSDFYALIKPSYLQMDKKISLGRNVSSIISDIKPSLNGVEILFAPAKDNDVEFFSDQTNIPLTTTEYINDKKQLLLKFSNTSTSLNKLIKDSSSIYYKSIEVESKDNITTITINLKDNIATYNIEIDRLYNNLPFAKLKFN